MSSAIDSNTYHYFVWGTFTIAEIMACGLGMQIIGLARGTFVVEPENEQRERTAVLPAILWRGIVLALLFAYVAEQTGSVAAHERALRGLWHEMTEQRFGFGALSPASAGLQLPR